MLKKSLIAACSLLCSTFVSASLQEQYPATSSHTLSNGSDVSVPFHIPSSQTSIVFGTSDAGRMQRFLDSNELEIITVPCQTDTGITAVFLQNIAESTLGPYNELVNTMLVKRKSAPALALPCLADSSDQAKVVEFISATLFALAQANAEKLKAGLPLDYGMYTQGLFVNTEDALLSGIEIWGFPKQYQFLDYQISDTRFSLSATSPWFWKTSIKIDFDTDHSNPLYPFGLNGDFFVPQTLADIFVEDRLPQVNGILQAATGTHAYLYPFSGVFELDPFTANFSLVTRYLKQSQFKPALVVEFDQVEAVFFENRK